MRIRVALVAAVVMGTASGMWLLSRQPLYRSEALLLVVRPRVLPETQPTARAILLPDDLSPVTRSTFSRLQLERILVGMGLYGEPDRQGATREDSLRRFRHALRFEPQGDDVWRLEFVYHDASIARRVVTRLSTNLVDEVRRQQEYRAIAIREFFDQERLRFESRIDTIEFSARLAKLEGAPLPRSKQLELDVMRARYRRMATAVADADIALALQESGLLGYLRIIAPASIDEKPVAPGVSPFADAGSAVGVAMGLVSCC